LRIGVVNYRENFGSKLVIYRENLHLALKLRKWASEAN